MCVVIYRLFAQTPSQEEEEEDTLPPLVILSESFPIMQHATKEEGEEATVAEVAS